jgi:hypothetical protein
MRNWHLFLSIHENEAVTLTFRECRIWGSQGGEYEDGCLLGYNAVQSGRSLTTFQRCLLPPSSGWLVTQKTAIFIQRIFTPLFDLYSLQKVVHKERISVNEGISNPNIAHHTHTHTIFKIQAYILRDTLLESELDRTGSALPPVVRFRITSVGFLDRNVLCTCS